MTKRRRSFWITAVVEVEGKGFYFNKLFEKEMRIWSWLCLVAVVGSCHSSSCSMFPFSLKSSQAIALGWLVRSIQIKSHCMDVVCYVCCGLWYIIMGFGGVVWSGGKTVAFPSSWWYDHGRKKARQAFHMTCQ